MPAPSIAAPPTRPAGTPSSAGTPSKARRVANVALLGLLSLLFAFIGAQKVFGAERMTANMAELHYGPAATVLIGLAEVVAAVALWWPRTRTATHLGLLLVMAGAAGSHVAAGHPPGQVVPSFVIASVIALSLVADRGRALGAFLFRRGAA